MPKPAGHALIVGTEAARPLSRKLLAAMGYEVDERDDPYAAMLDLCRRPLVYRAMVLSLQGLYRDEMSIISAVRRRFPHVAIWLANTDGRQGAMAEGLRMGAEAIITEEGIHSFSDLAAPPVSPTQFRPMPAQHDHGNTTSEPERTSPISTVRPQYVAPSEPVLTAEELKALLGDEI